MAVNADNPGVTAVVIAKNEERCIRDCLESLGSVDEIIVVDGMSTDRTRDICGEYTDKIHIRPPCGHPEPDREYACSLASNEWILLLDADERLCPELASDIHRVVRGDVDGYYVPRWNYMQPGYRAHCYFIDNAVRLAKRDKIAHATSIHTAVGVNGHAETLPDDKYYIIHTPPARSFHQTLDHYFKWGRVHALEMSKTRRFPRPVYLVYIPYRAAKEFFYNYVQRQGYKDGLFGLKWAMLWAIYWSYVLVLVGVGAEGIASRLYDTPPERPDIK